MQLLTRHFYFHQSFAVLMGIHLYRWIFTGAVKLQCTTLGYTSFKPHVE